MCKLERDSLQCSFFFFLLFNFEIISITEGTFDDIDVRANRWLTHFLFKYCYKWKKIFSCVQAEVEVKNENTQTTTRGFQMIKIRILFSFFCCFIVNSCIQYEVSWMVLSVADRERNKSNVTRIFHTNKMLTLRPQVRSNSWSKYSFRLERDLIQSRNVLVLKWSRLQPNTVSRFINNATESTKCCGILW